MGAPLEANAEKNQTGQHHNGTFHADTDVAFQKGFPHETCILAREGCQRQRSQCREHIQAEEAPVYRHNQNKGQRRNEQAAKKCDEPQRNGL